MLSSLRLHIAPFAFGLTLCSACAAPNALRPPDVEPLKATDYDYPGGVKVRKVAVIGPAHAEEKDAKAMRGALVSLVEGSFPPRDPKLPPVKVDLLYRARHEINRTYFLDLIAAFYLGLFPLTPQWGRTTTTLSFNVDAPPELKLENARFGLHQWGSESYSNMLYSWYRKGFVEHAYARAHEYAFDNGVNRLGAALAGQHVYQTPPLVFDDAFPRRGMRFDFDEKGELVKRRLLDPYAWRPIYNETIYDHGSAKAAPGFWHTYFSALSGIEGGYFRGAAWVSSEAIREKTGERFTIASGKATSEGYKFRLFNPPTVSRFFIYPTFGFFSLDIDIEDMEGDIELGNVPGAKDVPAIGTDPTTGAVVDLGAPNVYSLKLRSGHLGQRAGGTMVFGNVDTQLFFTFEGGVNLVEWRYTKATLGSYSGSKHHAAFFASFAARLLVGIAYRPLHVAARCEVNFEAYRSFDFPTPLPFEAPPVYNPELQIEERDPIKVDAASARTLNGYCGVSFAY